MSRVVLRGLLAWTTLCSCSILSDYPDSQTESAADVCLDGVDQDLDGFVDCEDPDCDGFCVEARSTCEDGRNNDGDVHLGVPLTDGLDPTCWDRGLAPGPRCTWTSGSTFDLSRYRAEDVFPGIDWISTGIVDPEGDDRLKEILLAPGRYVESVRPSTGDLRAMAMRTNFRARDGVTLEVRLRSDRTGRGVRVKVEMREGRAWGHLEDETGARSDEVLLEPFWDHEVWLEVTSDAVPRWRLYAVQGMSPVTMPVDPELARDEPLTVRFEVTSGGPEPVRISRLRLNRRSVDDCGRDIDSPLVSTRSLRGAAEGDRRCVVLDDLSVGSTDGRRWREGITPIRAGDLAIAWAPRFTRFEGARLDPETNELFLSASTDCSTWREASSGTPPAIRDASARLVGFDVIEGAPGGDRRLHFLVGSEDAYELVELASTSGLPFSYEEVGRSAWPFGVWTEGRALAAGRMGHELWVLGPGTSPDAIALWTVSNGEPMLVADPVVEPTNAPGTPDRFRVRSGTLVPVPIEGWDEPVSPKFRLYFLGNLLPMDPGFNSSFTRTAVSWRELTLKEAP